MPRENAHASDKDCFTRHRRAFDACKIVSSFHYYNCLLISSPSMPPAFISLFFHLFHFLFFFSFCLQISLLFRHCHAAISLRPHDRPMLRAAQCATRAVRRQPQHRSIPQDRSSPRAAPISPLQPMRRAR